MTIPEPATAGGEKHETEVGSVFVSNYPPFSFWGSDYVEQLDAVLASAPRPGTDLGLYFHIPFCRKRCKFCYFRVYTDKNADEIGTYLDALAHEVELYAQAKLIAGRPLKFVYFGGGTPSYISVKHLKRLVERLQAAIPWTGVEEVAFECEPGTLTRAKLEAVREIGVTRLSLGIENFNDEILRENGRAHESKEIFRCLPWIEEIGFEQLNIDLIAGMVGESWDTWRDNVARTVDLAPESVTIYQMELPFNTRFSKRLQEGTLATELADWDTKRAWHDHAIDELLQAGYEVSSGYTMVRGDKKGKFLYRDSVWHGCDMLGTGVASFSHLGGLHVQNVDGWGEYLATLREGRLPVGRAYATNESERLTRELILQLKLGEIGAGYFADKFGVDVLDRYAEAFAKLEGAGMLKVDGETVRLTRRGLLQVDTLLPSFYDPAHRNSRYT